MSTSSTNPKSHLLTSSNSDNASRPPARRSSAVVILLCFVAIVFDGYDLVVYGAIVPDLLAYEEWGLTPVETGAYGSYALAGMFIGAILVGYLTDIVGRRKVMLVSITAFSLLMLVAALAPNPFIFGLSRFLAGVGLGGVIPTAIAITVEFSAPHRRNLNNALMFSGYAVGGILASLLAMLLLEHIGFRGMLAIGALPVITVVPLLFFFLPESPAYLRVRGRGEEANQIARDYGLSVPSTPDASQVTAAGAKENNRFSELFTGRWAIATLLFCLAGVAGQILVYGLNTWMPQLLVMADYSLDSSLSFLLVTNIGAVVGVIVSSRLADVFGPKLVTAGSFLASGTALVLMGTGWFSMIVMYLLVAIVGFGSIGAQILVNGFVATFYNDKTRATALGLTLGVGRIGAVIAIYGGGVLVAANLSTFMNFSIWAIAAAIGILSVLLVPQNRR